MSNNNQYWCCKKQRALFGGLRNCNLGTSLVVQWKRILLPVQRTWLNPWSRKIPHAMEQLKPMRSNYWVWALEPMSCNYWTCVPQLLKPDHHRVCALQWEATTINLCTAMKNSLCSSQVEKAHSKQQQQRSSTAKNKLIKKIFF